MGVKELLRRAGEAVEAAPLFFVAHFSFPSSDVSTKKPLWRTHEAPLARHRAVKLLPHELPKTVLDNVTRWDSPLHSEWRYIH